MFNINDNYDNNSNMYIKSETVVLEKKNGDIKGIINGFKQDGNRIIRYERPLNMPSSINSSRCSGYVPKKLIVIPSSLKDNFYKSKLKHISKKGRKRNKGKASKKGKKLALSTPKVDRRRGILKKAKGKKIIKNKGNK